MKCVKCKLSSGIQILGVGGGRTPSVPLSRSELTKYVNHDIL
jgi:hypothetical protein